MKDSRLITYTVDTLLKDNYFRRGVCQISSVCSGGGGSASWGGITGTITDQTDLVTYISDEIGDVDLQSTTDNGNITSNTLQVTGAGNFNPTSSIVIAKDDTDGSGIYNIDSGGGFTGQMLFRSGFIRITRGTAQNFTIQEQTSTDPGILTSERVGGLPAENSGEFTTLGQVTDLISNSGINNVVVSVPPPSPLIPVNTYLTYNGEDDISFDLPDVAGNTGARIGIISMTTEIITLSSSAGGNDIYDNGTSVSELNILSGIVKIFYNNSLAWVALT